MNKIDELWNSACSNTWNNCITTGRTINNFISADDIATGTIFYGDCTINAVDYEKINREKEKTKMKVVTVRFLGSAREYEYWTDLDLKVGAEYVITADGNYKYGTPVVVVKFAQSPSFSGKLRKITKAEMTKKIEKKATKVQLKKLVFNKKKKTTAALWTDGTVTKVKLMDGEEWNEEYAFAFCILKKFFGDRGYTKKDFRKMLAAAERDYGAEEEILEKNSDAVG